MSVVKSECNCAERQMVDSSSNAGTNGNFKNRKSVLSLDTCESDSRNRQSLNRHKWTVMSWMVISSMLLLMLSHVSTASAAEKSSSSDATKKTASKWNWKEMANSKFNVGVRSRDLSQTQSGNVNSPLHVAQCRATCLQKFNNRGDGIKASSCFHHPDCFTCWKSCELLESSWSGSSTTTSGRDDKVLARSRPMCSQPRLCLSGCQVACKFYQEMVERRESVADPVVHTSRENVLVYSEGKIQWPRKPNRVKSSPDFLVYVVIQEYPDHRWRQITQTTESQVEIPRGLASQKSNKLRSVRVLVVGPDGLVTMYNPQLASTAHNGPERTTGDSSAASLSSSTTTTTTSGTPEQTNGQQPSLQYDDTSLPGTLLSPVSAVSSDRAASAASDPWKLRRVSLIHQKFLVIAELTWNAAPEAKDYLITWELDGGGLKGHLVTDSTTVTLSLWPDTLYHIQVELFGEEHSSLHKKSFPLAMDTSQASFPMEQPSALSKKESSHKSVTEFLNVTLLVTISSVVLVLVSLALALCCWCMRRAAARRSGDPQLLQDTDEPGDPLQPHILRKGLVGAPSVAMDATHPTQLIFPEKVEWVPADGPWTTDSYFQNHNRHYNQTLPTDNGHLQQNYTNVYLPTT